MRRAVLEPPRRLSEAAHAAAEAEPPVRETLGSPAPAREERRHLFHPRRGWFRRLERFCSNQLATELYPRVPGLHRLYDHQLRRHLTLSEAEIALPRLDRALEGTTVLFISDVHAGPFISPQELERTFERLLSVAPDLILLGGDLVTTTIDEMESHGDAFRSLRAPLGVFGVLGNHDHYTGEPERVCDAMEACGIRPLVNRAVMLEVGGRPLHLAGVDDRLIGEPDLDRALAGTAAPTLLVSHNPDLAFDAARRGVGLMLSGHTHGGQMRIPGLPVLVRQSRYRLDEGRYRVGEMELVVSRGLGAVGLPWRIACPPEAVLLRLASHSNARS